VGLRVERVRGELAAWWDEVIVENGPRYSHPGQWVHLWTDLWVATFEHLHYTLGHVVAVLLPLWAVWSLLT
jgi:hypothetical protein